LRCFFTSDLHGSIPRYRALWRTIEQDRPRAVLLGGDLLPHFGMSNRQDLPQDQDFFEDFLVGGFRALREKLGDAYPAVFLILGNDDARVNEEDFLDPRYASLWHYAHKRCLPLDDLTVVGYAHVPPSPFQLKDWEKYDVSRFVDPGCVSPEDGRRSVPVDPSIIRYATIAEDLEILCKDKDLGRCLLLTHSPPYKTNLDRAALDGKMVDHVPLDVHVGSIAIKRFIEKRQPLVSLHGHIHESTRLTGQWRDTIGETLAINGAHDGPELPLVRFDTDDLENATRDLIS
jgi:uncharacterized protein